VKIQMLIVSAILTLGMTSGAQAQTAPAVAVSSAAATMVLAHCDGHSDQPCGLGHDAAPQADKNNAPEALPANDPKRAQEVEPVAQVPEPQTFVMLMLGLVVLGFASRRGDASEKFSD
jgi:hypothetical protein